MEFIKQASDAASQLIPLLATIAIVVGLLSVADRAFRRRWQDNPDA